MNTPQVYFFLGAAGSERRAVVADLIANGLDEGARPLLLTSTAEELVGDAVQQRLAAVPALVTASWSKAEDGPFVATIPDGTSDVFFLSDGRGNPVDQVEAFRAWLGISGAELARVITIVNCQLASAHPELLRWYDACVHFSDVVLLSRRSGVPNKWISDFVARYRKQHFPCLIEPVKHSGIEHPAIVLTPEARRISMCFDVEEDWPSPEEEEEKRVAVARGDVLPVTDLIGAVDPYIERFPSGRRVKEIPDIERFLGP